MSSKANYSFLETVRPLGSSIDSAHFSLECVFTSMRNQHMLIGYIALRHSSIKLQTIAVPRTDTQKA